jgi:hypothetical protein
MKQMISITLSTEIIKKVEEDSKKEIRSKSQIIDLILKKHYKIGG